MSTQVYQDIPAYGSAAWKNPVANAAALPLTGNTDGDARVAKDTDTIYIWNAGSNAWVPVSGGGGGGVTSFNTRTGAVTLLSADVTGALGYTPENVANKATNFTTLNNILYPTTQAVANYVATAVGPYVLKAGDTMTGALTLPQLNVNGGTSLFTIKWNSSASKYEISTSDDFVWSANKEWFSSNEFKWFNAGAGTQLLMNGSSAAFTFLDVSASTNFTSPQYTVAGGNGSLVTNFDSPNNFYLINAPFDAIKYTVGSNFTVFAGGDVALIAGGLSGASSITASAGGSLAGNTTSNEFIISDVNTGARFRYDGSGNFEVRSGSAAGNGDIYTFGYQTYTFNSSTGDQYNVVNAAYSANQLAFLGSGESILYSLNTQNFSILSDGDLYLVSNQQDKKTYFNTTLVLNDPFGSGEVARIKVVSPNTFGIGTNVLSAAATSGVNGTIALGRDVLTGPAGQYTGISNTFIGAAIAASGNVTTASNNVGIGEGALYSLTTGTSNLAIGGGALYATTTDNNLLAVGNQAGQNATGASGSLFIGTSAGSQAINAAGSTFIGTGTGSYINGQLNVGIGAACLSGNQPTSGSNTANENLFIGSNTGLELTTGGYNISLGNNNGGWSLSSGSHNLIIGAYINLASKTADGQMSIKNALFGTGLTSTGTTVASGNLGAFVAAPTARLDIIGSGTGAASLRIRSGTAPSSPNDGDIWYDGTNLKMRIGGVTKTFTLV